MGPIGRLLGAVILCVSASTAMAGEVEERTAIVAATDEAFLAGRFAELEATRDRYLATAETTASGVPKLTVFYESLKTQLLYKSSLRPAVDAFAAQARLWVEAFPDSTAAAITLAKAHSALAWLIRGPGFADTVENWRWKGFAAALDDAGQELRRVAASSRDDPEWFVSMLALTMESGQGHQIFDPIAQEALERHPAYISIHHAILRAELPQWGGSWESLDAAVSRIVAHAAEDRRSEVYTRAYWWLQEKKLPWTLFRDSKVDWPRMRTGFEDVVARYPTDWNLNIYALHACLAHDEPTLLGVLERLQGRLIEIIWPVKDFMTSCASVIEAKRRDSEDAAHYAKPQPPAEEKVARNEIVAATAADFIAGRFDRLDAVHDELLATKATTPSGAWKLEYFYDGLAPFAWIYAPPARPDQPSFDKVRAQTVAWLAAAPTSKAAVIARARIHWAEARFLRLGKRGPFDQSTDDRTPQAFAELAAARKLLDESRDRASDDPEWWATMVQVAYADRTDIRTQSALASEALAAAPDYPRTLSAILQRAWGPEPGLTFAEAVHLVLAASPANAAPEVYARSALWLAEVNRRPDLVSAMKLDKAMLKAGLDTVVRSYPSDWNLNAAASLACMSVDKSAASALLARIDGRIIEERWPNWRAPKACADWTAADSQQGSDQ